MGSFLGAGSLPAGFSSETSRSRLADKSRPRHAQGCQAWGPFRARLTPPAGGVDLACRDGTANLLQWGSGGASSGEWHSAAAETTALGVLRLGARVARRAGVRTTRTLVGSAGQPESPREGAASGKRAGRGRQ